MDMLIGTRVIVSEDYIRMSGGLAERYSGAIVRMVGTFKAVIKWDDLDGEFEWDIDYIKVVDLPVIFLRLL